MKHEFRLLNDILAKAITVKAGSFDSVTVERFQMMTAIQYGLKVNWGKVLFTVLKGMVDRSQKKAKGFAAQIGFLLKSIPVIPMGDDVPFPSAKVLSMRTVHTYIVTNTTIDARTESEEPGMAKTPKAKKKPSSADEMPVDMFAEFTASKKSSATEADAPIITKKRRTGKSKFSASQAKLDIVQVATDVEPIQIVDPTHDAATVPSPVLKRKSRKRKLVLSRDSDDESVGPEEIIKEADAAVAMSTVEADIAKVLEETLELEVSATERESQGVDEALFEEDFTRWLDDFVARHNEPELNSFAYVSTTVGRRSIKKTALITSSSRHMFRGNSDACVSAIGAILTNTNTALLTSLHLIVFKGNRSAYVSIADKGLYSLHSQMASAFISYSYQINFESVLMIHDHEGMVNMFKALEASGLRRFLGCESILYETELGHFFDTALIQDEDITCVISGKFVSISPTMFTKVFDLPTEGITNFSEVPKDKVYDARSLFSQKGVQIDVHGKKKYMKHEFRLLNDILAKAITVKAGSFDSVTVERFQMMTAIQYGLKVNWGKVLFTVLKGMVDSAKVLSMRTVHTYIVTNTTIDARVQVATDVEPIQIVDPTHDAATVPSPVLKRKSRKRKLVLSRDSDDESVGPEEIIKEADAAVAMSTVEADIAKVLEETLELGVSATERESQGVDEALFEEDFTRWLDDFVARHNEPELVSTHNEAQAAGSIHSVADKEVNMPIDDLLIQICDAPLLPVTAAEVTMLRLGAFSSSVDKGKAKLGEDEQVTDDAAKKMFALICRDVEVLVQVRDSLMQAVVDFFASFSLNSMPDMDSLKDLKEKERLMMAWAETNTLAIARYLTPDLPGNAMAVQIANLLSVAHSHSIEDLKAQQQELNIEMVQSHSSLPAMNYIDSDDVRLAHFFSIANSSCWVRPVFLMNGVWTPVQGPEFWESSCQLSLFLNKLQIPAPAIQEIFVAHISFIAPDQYWATVPWLMRIWRWAKVCEEVVEFGLSGSLRPARKDVCHAITVFNLGVERIPANFLRLFVQGLACNSFADSVVKKDLGNTEEVVLTGIEEVELVSSDVSTVYRSPSPPSPGVDSLEHDLRFALGPAIFSRVEQEERLYFVQSPDSPPVASPHHASSSSSIDVSLHFDDTDVPVRAQADTQAPASADFTKFTERIHTSNCEMLSKLNAVEVGVRGDLLKMQSLLCQSFETACRVLEREGNTHTAQFNDLKKGLMAPVGTISGNLFDIKKKQREQDARLLAMDEQIAAIRNDHLEFQSKIAADILSLSTQVGDIVDFLRSGVAKKGEMGSSSRPTTGSSSRPTTVRAQTQTLPPTTGTFEERVAQARRHIIESGQVISIEEAAERVMEADRRESERFDDVSHKRTPDIMTSPFLFSYDARNRYDDVSRTEICYSIDMMTSPVLKFAKG
ncbi:hypothetical protein F511_05040 [Dorcoceras hygrometricum]|uniref:Dystroglycan-like n=1 Tax=Dorcoceras hygrometricum TaxID=472368 RepID=A0A2Z7AN36_9LAMI|nr:hypothetical protein F511_05040 [Dorcoceras hygrometricum]